MSSRNKTSPNPSSPCLPAIFSGSAQNQKTHLSQPQLKARWWLRAAAELQAALTGFRSSFSLSLDILAQILCQNWGGKVYGLVLWLEHPWSRVRNGAPRHRHHSVHCSFLGCARLRCWSKSSLCPPSRYLSFWSIIGEKYLAIARSLVSSVWPFWWIIKGSCCLLSTLQIPRYRQNFSVFLF